MDTARRIAMPVNQHLGVGTGPSK